ncbi:MAG: 1-aminocyclopropane-1-carboxylate deaminase [Desulfurococcaceae archaeon]|nr:MAG: 1-aminocyclopropane-1-carboxylate deaminase [Desulfurococcaceae archaeon]
MIPRILDLPRFRLINTMSPLEKAVNLSRELGIDLYIKRDDLLELALGGNKVRKLEFILGDALRKGCDTLITTGAVHSNHARLTAAAARKAGLDAYLVLTPPGLRDPKGNLLLDRLFGAKVIYVDSREEADEAMERLAKDLEGRGRKPYIVRRGGASPQGVMGYALAAYEILMQAYGRGIKPNYIVHATGTGATQAGLILGSRLVGLDAKIIGISVGSPADKIRKEVHSLVLEGAKYAGIKGFDIDPEDIVVIDRYTYGGYGSITKEVVEAITHVARKEALLLDPVYTAKAMLGLMDLVDKGYIEKESKVIFIHTGGIPIIFQYDNILTQYIPES